MPLKDIIGHDKTVELLKNLFSGDRTLNTYLFAGPEGVGKKFCAKELAKYVNCKEERDDACGKCPSCEKIERGIHPDVEIIATEDDAGRKEVLREYRAMQGNVKPDGKSPAGENIKIEQIREFQKNSFYRPFQGRYRVLIVDGAEMMTEEAANCMLKILEEPPEYLIIILVTSKPHSMLPTILSRCSRINFKSLNEKAITGILRKRISENENMIGALVSVSGGSVGKALEFYANGAVENYYDIGLCVKERRTVVYDDFAVRYAGAPDRAGFLRKQRNVMRDLLYFSQIWQRHVLVSKFTDARQENSIEEDVIAELSAKRSTADLINAIDRMEFLYECIDSNVNPKIVLENINMEIIK